MDYKYKYTNRKAINFVIYWLTMISHYYVQMVHVNGHYICHVFELNYTYMSMIVFGSNVLIKIDNFDLQHENPIG